MKRFLLLVCLVMLSYHGMAQRIQELVTVFEADRNALKRKYFLNETKEYYSRMEEFYSLWKAKLKTLSQQNISGEEKADYVLLRNQIEKESYYLLHDFNEFKEIVFVVDFAEPLYNFIDDRSTGRPVNGQSLANDFFTCYKAIEISKQKILGSPFTHWRKAAKAASIINTLRDGLKEAHDFYFKYDPSYTWWLEQPFAQLDTALSEYEDFLKKHFSNSVADDGSGIIGMPIDREQLIKELQFEFIPYSPEELIRLAEIEFAWCEREMIKASQDLGAGMDWKAALEKVKSTYVAPGDQPAMVKKLADEAVAFLETKDLITIPVMAKEIWRMKMMSPEGQKLNPFFLGGEEIIISYPTHDMPHDLKRMSMRGNNPHFSKATVHHELIPGHHLQGFMLERYKPYRHVFETPFWIEGWALYWEMNFWDKGFASTPQDRVGMLFWRMHRCARIIFSLNFHLGKMTPMQCINFLVDRVGHERANAEAEVRRSFMGSYGPLYQIAYMVGGLQLYALKKEFVSRYSVDEKVFHDRVLQEGAIPIEILRLILLDNEINADYSTAWKFLK